jgi:hypothetical protein
VISTIRPNRGIWGNLVVLAAPGRFPPQTIATELHNELETVTLLLQRAAQHQSNILQRMLRASAVDPQYTAAPVELGQRFLQ